MNDGEAGKPSCQSTDRENVAMNHRHSGTAIFTKAKGESPPIREIEGTGACSALHPIERATGAGKESRRLETTDHRDEEIAKLKPIIQGHPLW